MNIEKNKQFINNLWDDSIIPTLEDYIRIPNKSPLFDPAWKENGFMDEAVKLLTNWCFQNAIPNMNLQIVSLPERTPLIFIDIPGNSDDTVLLYGHLDKQPEMTGWDEDLGPFKPILRQEKLYGRGGADDGYAIFASFAAIKSLNAQNLPHARCIILIEASEESGSRDLPFYIEMLKDKIGQPSLIICLDSGCNNYDQLWITTSLRGMVGGILSIDILNQGVHSGTASGIVPSCFLVLRQLLDRVEHKNNGEIILSDLLVDIPPERREQAEKTAQVLNKKIYEDFPFKEGVHPLLDNLTELLLNNTWRPALSIIGADGLPPCKNAGNVLLPSIKVKLSLRLPPTCQAEQAISTLKKTFESHPPFNAKVTFEVKESGTGWNAKKTSPWLLKATNEASKNYFGADAMYMGEGASIPFMGMLGKRFPNAQFVITGVLGPHSNAHGPNEFLHIPTAKKITNCIAEIIATHFYENRREQ